MARQLIPDVVHQQDLLTLAPGASVREAARRMTDRRVGAALVTDNGRLVGIITERDVMARVVAEGRDADRTPVRDAMTANPITATPDQRTVDALKAMYEGGFRHLPIVEDGHPVGIVSMRDFLPTEVSEMQAELEEEERLKKVAR
jgi:CBS domain-containing protein